jgi:acid phosphatase (class A)
VRASLYMSTVFMTSSDIGRLIGYWINPQKLPLIDTLFSNIAVDANYFLWSLKFKFERVRPFNLEPKIHDLEESFASSYPGGHVTFAYIYAYIYQELAPEFMDFFIVNANAMAHAREVIGVHYPSDSECARVFARQFVNMLLRNRKFLDDFQKVKKEWELKRKQG